MLENFVSLGNQRRTLDSRGQGVVTTCANLCISYTRLRQTAVIPSRAGPLIARAAEHRHKG